MVVDCLGLKSIKISQFLGAIDLVVILFTSNISTLSLLVENIEYLQIKAGIN